MLVAGEGRGRISVGIILRIYSSEKVKKKLKRVQNMNFNVFYIIWALSHFSVHNVIALKSHLSLPLDFVSLVPRSISQSWKGMRSEAYIKYVTYIIL